MGGIPPLGYDVVDRKLVINESETDTVKTCFQTYLEKSGLIEAVIELNRRGLMTKSFTSRKGRVQQAKPWVAKDLHRILTNPVYCGLIRHKENEYPGEHEAIIDESLWQQVQTKLRDHQPEAGKITGHLNETAIARTRLLHPLKGFVLGIGGQALTPTYTNKSEKSADGTRTRKRYRYYVSQQAIRQGYGSSLLKTISASLLEDAVRRMLIHSIPELGEYASPENLSAGEIRHRLDMHATLSGSDPWGISPDGWPKPSSASLSGWSRLRSRFRSTTCRSWLNARRRKPGNLHRCRFPSRPQSAEKKIG